jgi:hypothetical protein
MHPHFLKEEEYALPPLGLLRDVAEGSVSSEMRDILPLTDKLKADLPQMLAEHQAIVNALARLESLAVGLDKREYVEFAEALRLHAQTEEEVMYPAAILVGEYIRQKTTQSEEAE